MKIKIRHTCPNFNTYRAARVKSLFNADSGCQFNLDAEFDLEWDWSIGVVVGPSGSGKSSIGHQLFGGGQLYDPTGWPQYAPVIDAIAPDGDFNFVTASLAAVGLVRCLSG